MESLRTDFINRIKQARAETGCTILELAALLDVPYTTLQGWLAAGKFPRPNTYDRVIIRLEEIMRHERST